MSGKMNGKQIAEILTAIGGLVELATSDTASPEARAAATDRLNALRGELSLTTARLHAEEKARQKFGE